MENEKIRIKEEPAEIVLADKAKSLPGTQPGYLRGVLRRTGAGTVNTPTRFFRKEGRA